MLQGRGPFFGLKFCFRHSETTCCGNVATFVLVLATGVQTMPEKDLKMTHHRKTHKGREKSTRQANSHERSSDQSLSILFTMRPKISPELPFVYQTILEEIKRMLQKESTAILRKLTESFLLRMRNATQHVNTKAKTFYRQAPAQPNRL